MGSLVDLANMPARPVQVSIDESLLRRVDADPEVKKKGRSAFVQEALRAHLRARERMRIDERIREAYEGSADAMLRETQDFLAGQSWPDE